MNKAEMDAIGERLTDPSTGEDVGWFVRPSAVTEPTLTEAPCPMCGRNCSHGRISTDDLRPLDALMEEPK